MSADEKPNCFKCKYLQITYQKNFPYSCRAMGFKSVKMPSLVVYESSGYFCQAFEEKKIKKN